MRIAAIGDVCGQPGLLTLGKNLRLLRRQEGVHFIVVNGENASMRGITPKQARWIFDAGADVITLGNHAYAQRSICDYLDDGDPIIRPHNLAPQLAGTGFCHVDYNGVDICVINLLGRLNMDFRTSDPFETADRLLKQEKADIFLVDFHAEATSEKKALGYFLDGRVSAVWGTHTHVQTADERILPQGTGFLTDLGMTGAQESVIGVKYQQSVSYFRGELGPRFETSDLDCALLGAIFDIDEKTGRCQKVQRVNIR